LLNKPFSTTPTIELIFSSIAATSAIGFFQYIHSNPLENSWKILKNVLATLNANLYKGKTAADPETIQKYVSEKVTKNLQIIKDSSILKELLKYDTIIVNGVEYKNLQDFEELLSEENLLKIFLNDRYSVIHGDLTIENIICDVSDSNIGENFYIIDPNIGNIHDSMFLDYGKLLQSLHGGYEFMMKTKNVKVEGNHIDFTYTRSAAYDYLFKHLDEYMLAQFGEEGRRSIYYHEIIHWLRLMPYKLRKDKDRAAMFFAGLVMVVNQTKKMTK